MQEGEIYICINILLIKLSLESGYNVIKDVNIVHRGVR